MFTVTPLKIVLVLAVIGILWWWHRRNQIRARERAELDRDNPAGSAQGKTGWGKTGWGKTGWGKTGWAKTKNSPAKPVEDMAQCRVCGAYVPAKGASRCGRDNCPF